MDNTLRQMAFFVFAKVGKGGLSSNDERDFEIKKLQYFFSLLYIINRFHDGRSSFQQQITEDVKMWEEIQ